MLGGETRKLRSVIPTADITVVPTPGPSAAIPGGPTQRVPLGRVYGSRSGDKGGNANLGVFARSDEAWAWLEDFLTVEKLGELLPEVRDFKVDRHPLPALRSVHFLIHGLLEEGVAS